MMKSKHIYWLFVSFLLVTACHSSKKATEKTVQEKQLTASDLSYIEKFHKGVQLKTTNQVDAAIAQFEECATIRPKDDAVYFALSELYQSKKNDSKSAENIKKASSLDPDNIWYLQEMAYMNYDTKNYSEAVKNFEALTKKEPQNVDWLYGYAECLVQSGKTEEAIKALDKTEEQVGRVPELAIEKFKLYVQIKQPEKGIQEIEAARKEFPEDQQLLATLIDYYFQNGQDQKAITMLEELVKVDPENGRAHLVLADVYRQRGETSKAYAELKEAFLSDQVDIDTKMHVLISIYDSGVRVDDNVLELVNLMTEQYPDDAKAYSIQGDFYLREDKNAEALTAYKKALEFDQNQFPIWNQVMLMEYQTGQFDSLYTDSKKCLEYFPNVALPYLMNGIGAIQTKKYDEAVTSLETGKELITNDKELEGEFYSQLGDAYFGKDNLENGKKNYEKALQLNPGSDLVKNNYAYRLAMHKTELNYALKLIEEALSEGETAHYLDTKGFILFQQGKYQEAKEFYAKAYKLLPDDKIINEHMGDAAIKTGNSAEAETYWKKAKELGSTNKKLDAKIQNKTYYDPVY